MKPYKDQYKFEWTCPFCGKQKHAGGAGHIEAQGCGHLRRKHKIFEWAGVVFRRSYDKQQELESFVWTHDFLL